MRARWIVYRVPMACLNLTPRGIAFEVVSFRWIEEEKEDFLRVSKNIDSIFFFFCVNRGIIRKSLRSAKSSGGNDVCSSSLLIVSSFLILSGITVDVDDTTSLRSTFAQTFIGPILYLILKR